ncbi:MAG: roadblock/LC7 domain-containing protein [Thermodesulfobacteriota bacterium]
MNRTESLEKILKDLQGEADIEASALFTEDGLVIASSMPYHLDRDHISALSAAMLAMAKRTCSELKQGGMEQLMLKGEEGYAVIQSAGEFSALVTITKESATLGLVFLRMKQATEQIVKILST